MSTETKSIWAKIIEFIINIISSVNKEETAENVLNNVRKEAEADTPLKDRLRNTSSEIISGMSEAAKDEAVAQTSVLLLTHGDYLLGLTEAQKDYAIEIAFLRSISNLDKLSFEELKEYRDSGSKALELGITVTTEMNAFWTAFGEAVKSIINVAADIGARSAATALKILLL